MSKVIRGGISLATEREVRSVLLIDAQTVSTDKEKFVDANLLGYYICINTWLLLIKQYTAFTWLNVKERIVKNGLVATIGFFAEAAQKLVQDGSLEDDSQRYALPKAILREVTTYCGNLPILTDDRKRINTDPLATALQLFRYAKRFSPLYTDKLADASIAEFISEQNRLKLLQRREHSSWLVDLVRYEVNNLIDWPNVIQQIAGIRIDDIQLTHGAGSDANSSIGSKLRTLSCVTPDYFHRWSWETLPASIYEVNEGWYGSLQCYPIHVAEVRAVPKSYKTARIIAMEETYRQAYAKRMFTILSDALPSQLNIHDQTRNQEYARLGSVNSDLATLDLSHASDDIQCNTVWEVFPPDFVRILEKVRPTHYRVNGKIRLLHSFMTMGNAMTFVLETILFAAIARAAVRYVVPGSEDLVSVYGDDIICPTQAAATVCDFLEMFGFQVNRDKSFIEGSYRESCGEEYLNGECLTTHYFPRFAIQGTLGDVCKLATRVQRDSYTDVLTDTSTRLIALQHRLITVCPPAARIVEEIVRESNPKMTMSLIGSDSEDLWGYDTSAHQRKEPYYTLNPITEKITYFSGQSHQNHGFGKPIEVFRFKGFTWKRVDPPHSVDYHVKPKVTFEVSGPISDADRQLYDMYRYNRFLKYGPRFEDPLLELLKVSSRDQSIDEVFGFPKILWR